MNIDKYNLTYSQPSKLEGTQEVDVNIKLNNVCTNSSGGIEGTVVDINGKP